MATKDAEIERLFALVAKLQEQRRELQVEIARLTAANNVLYERLVDRNAEVARLRSEVVRLLAVLHVMEVQLNPVHPNRGNDGSLVPM